MLSHLKEGALFAISELQLRMHSRCFGEFAIVVDVLRSLPFPPTLPVSIRGPLQGFQHCIEWGFPPFASLDWIDGCELNWRENGSNRERGTTFRPPTSHAGIRIGNDGQSCQSFISLSRPCIIRHPFIFSASSRSIKISLGPITIPASPPPR